PATAPPACLATDPFAPESCLLVAADAPVVAGVDQEPDPVQPERSESIVEEEPDRFRTDALALLIAVADQDPEFGRPVRERQPMQPAGPDQPLPFPERDAEHHLLGPLVELLEPLPFLDGRHRPESV